MNASEPIVITTDLPPLRKSSRLIGWFSGLRAAIIVVVAVGIWYATQIQEQAPASSSPLGLTLGVCGFLFMLGAQTLYTLRKRLHGFNRGRMSAWLQSHIFLGLVGAFLALLHTAGKFNGLAGCAAATTVIMIVSGFVGRYIYTAAPRTLEGVEIDARELMKRFADIEHRLYSMGVRFASVDIRAINFDVETPSWIIVFARPLLQWSQRRRVRRFVHRLPQVTNVSALELSRLLTDRYELQLDIGSIATTRNWISWWHVLHVPLSWTLFTLAIVHIFAAIRYSHF